MGERDTLSQHRASDAVLAFLTGTFLALVLLGYFFMIEVYLSSAAISFVVLACSWLIGSLAGLRLKAAPRRFYVLLVAGAVAYYVGRVLLGQFPHNLYLLPALAACVALSGLVAGNFFPYAQERFPRVKYLLLHENNGFLLGLALSLSSSVFAGKWFLDTAPVIGLLPVAGTLLYQRYLARKEPSRSVEVVTAPLLVASDHMFPLFVSGLHFGILSVSLFLTVQVFVSASLTALLVVVVAWIVGIILNMNFGMPRSLSGSMGISIVSYYVLLIVTSVFTPFEFLFPLIGIFITLAALPAGAFLREFASRFSNASIFLHQNNGFVLGYVLTLFGFAEWGVNFLYWAPLLSYATAFLGQSRRSFPAFTCMIIVTFLCIEMDSPETFWTLVVAVALGGACFFWRHRTGLSLSHSSGKDTTAQVSATGGSDQLPAWAGRAILFLAGLNVMQLHYLASREFSSVLGTSEFSVLLITAAYLTGLSVGYGASRALPLALVKSLAPFALLSHLFLAVFARVIAGILISQGHGVEVLFGLLFVAALCTSAFFAVIIPRLIDHMESGSLTSSTGWSLAGAACGVVGTFVLIARLPAMLWPAYFMTMLVLVVLLLRRTGWVAPTMVIGVFSIGLFIHYQGPLLDYAAEDFYRSRNYGNPRLVFRGSSLHHSIEVIETSQSPEDESPRFRISFVDGVENFRREVRREGGSSSSADSSRATYFLAELPAKHLYAKKNEELRILILGGGPSDSAYRARDYASKITLVEIDRLVMESARAHWSDVHRHDKVDQLEVVIDDPLHFLKTTPERFDLIINHGGALNDLRTALLYGREFYELVKTRLAPGGIFVESTRQRPLPESHGDHAMRIFRSVADTFPSYRLIETSASLSRPSPGENGYIFASGTFDFSTEELSAVLEEDGVHEGTRTHHPGCHHFQLYKVVPISLSNMDTLFETSDWRKHGLYAGSDDAAGAGHQTAGHGGSGAHTFLSSLLEDSRLVQAVIAKAKERRFRILVTAMLLAAAAARVTVLWSNRKRSRPSVVVVHENKRRRKGRRKRKGATAHHRLDRV